MGLKDLLLQGPTANNQSLVGNAGTQFSAYTNTAFGIGGEPGPPNAVDTIAEASLTQDYNYTHGDSSATAVASQLDLNGNKGPQFANYRNKAYGNLTEPDPTGGPDNIVDTIAETSLTQDYNYTHGNSSATANATLHSLGGNKGSQFANYRNKAYGNLTEPDPAGGPDNIVDTIAETSLTQDYNYTHGGSSATANATLYSLGGNKGSQFADYRNKAYGNALEPSPNALDDTIAERSLTQPYNYTHGLSSATAGGPDGSMFDKNGLTPTPYEQLGPPDGRY